MSTSTGRRLLVPALAAALALAVAAPVAWALSHRGQDAAAGQAEPAQRQQRSPGPADGGSSGSAVAQVPVRDASLAALTAAQALAPVRVELPSVGIAAQVDQVGVAPDGQMELPPDPDRLGWYRFGPAPGSPQGSAVLAAHVDSRRYGLGQFARLQEASVGDLVTVLLADGRSLAHQVVEVRAERKQALALDTLFRRDGQPTLVLVTCGGAYVPDAGGYEDNVIVTAVPLGAVP